MGNKPGASGPSSKDRPRTLDPPYQRAQQPPAPNPRPPVVAVRDQSANDMIAAVRGGSNSPPQRPYQPQQAPQRAPVPPLSPPLGARPTSPAHDMLAAAMGRQQQQPPQLPPGLSPEAAMLAALLGARGGSASGGGGGGSGMVCDFATSGPNFHPMQVYVCRTCNFRAGDVCCRACAESCHRGHNLASQHSNGAFCDCGATPSRWGCRCMPSGPVSAAPQYAVADAETAFTSLQNCLQRAGIRFGVIGPRKLDYYMNGDVGGNQERWRIVWGTRGDECLSVVQFVPTGNVEPSRRMAMMEFVTRANYALKTACWDIDMKDGQVLLRDAVWFAGIPTSQLEQFIPELIRRDMNIFTQYLPGIKAVMGGQDAQSAVTQCENGGIPLGAGARPGGTDANAMLAALLQEILSESGGSSQPAVSSQAPSSGGNSAQPGAPPPMRRESSWNSDEPGRIQRSLSIGRGPLSPKGGPRPDEKTPTTSSQQSSGSSGDSRQSQESLESSDFYIGRDKLEVALDDDSLIGEGGFGKVYRGSYCGLDVAVKVVKADDEGSGQSFVDEILRQRAITHPRILSVIGVSKDRGRWLMITELCTHRSLADVLAKEEYESQLSWQKRKSLALEAAQGMWFLHSKNIIHLDLKPQNLMIVDGLHVRIGDFGLSKTLASSVLATKAADANTPQYCAPETVSELPVGKPADVFSFGIILYQLFTNRMPYDDEQVPPYVLPFKIARGLRPTIPSDLAEPRRKLLEDCWQAEPTARPTFGDIIKRLEAL